MTKKKIETKEKKVTKIPEAKYGRAEIIQSAAIFGESQEVVAGALRLLNKSEYTRNEIEDSIQKFKKRKV